MGQICVVSLEPRRNRINRNERTTSKRTPQFSVGISEKWPYDLPSIPNFRDFLSNRHPSRSSFFCLGDEGKRTPDTFTLQNLDFCLIGRKTKDPS